MTEFSTGRACGASPNDKIAHSQRSHHARQVLFDQADALDGLDGGVDELFVAGGEREGQGIIDQVLRFEAVVVYGNIVDALCDLELALARFGHAVFVDGQHDDGRVMGPGQA